MQKTSNSHSGFLTRRTLLALLLCTAACSIATGTLLAVFHSETPANRFQRTLTFAERVAYQRAIEDVYWRHQIWPKDRPDPKPPLDAVMSQAQLEKKVADYLRKSQVLEDYWQRPITAEQLQAEMDRMAKHTRQPEVLRELFAALGNDPFVIAECLARPALAERLLASGHPYDPGINGELKTKLLAHSTIEQVKETDRTDSRISGPAVNYSFPAISDMVDGCIDNSWTATSLTNAPTARAGHTAVWTGTEMIVWGGDTNTGGKYNPSTDSWTATSTTNAPAARSLHTAVWTGSEMIVWGGIDASFNIFNSGGKYNPITDSWVATNLTNAPTARYIHTAVWTGSEMIVWGGTGANYFDTGGKYNPNTDSWTATSTVNAPTGRYDPTSVWTGSEMIVWGGTNDTNDFNTGGRYNPITNSWVATSTINAPDARIVHTAVWTGNEMIIWGGLDENFDQLNTGGKYSPGANNWTPTSTTSAPTARYSHTAVWTGSQMIVWGGFDGGSYFNTGGRYNPATNSWTATSISNAPDPRSDQTAVWTDTEMIVWGGSGPVDVLNTGGRYCAQFGPSPTPTPTATTSPSATATVSPTATPTGTSTPTVTPSNTPRLTPTPRSRPSPRARPTPPPHITTGAAIFTAPYCRTAAVSFGLTTSTGAVTSTVTSAQSGDITSSRPATDALGGQRTPQHGGTKKNSCVFVQTCAAVTACLPRRGLVSHPYENLFQFGLARKRIRG